jgi:TRAP-type C4-dicarboxylate transport system substrate-binding protein/DNA-binding transcriptional regulator YiaG
MKTKPIVYASLSSIFAGERLDMAKASSIETLSIGDRVRAARKSLAMRQSDLSVLTGLPASHLSEIERGSSLPTIPTLRKLSDALNRPLEYFFQETQDIPRSFGMIIHWASVGGQAANRFAQLVDERTAGEIKLRIYHCAELGSAKDQLEALMEGGIHLYIDEPLSFEPFAGLCGPVFLPFFFEDRGHYQRFLESELFETHIYRKMLDRGIRLLNPASNWQCGSFEVLFSTEPIFRPEDLRGRKFRSYPSQAAIALRRALGAEPVVVEWEGAYEAFETGRIDTLLVPAAYFAALQAHKTAKYATVLRYGYTLNLTVAISEREYTKLSPGSQRALAEAAEEAGEFCTKLANRRTEQDLEALSSRHNLPVIQPDPEAWRTAFSTAIEQVCRDGILANKLYDALQAV